MTRQNKLKRKLMFVWWSEGHIDKKLIESTFINILNHFFTWQNTRELIDAYAKLPTISCDFLIIFIIQFYKRA